MGTLETGSRRRVVLANMTLGDVAPIELIEAAAAGGFDSISLRIVTPSPTHFLVPVTGNETLLREIEQRLADTAVDVLDVGGIWLHPDMDVESYLPAFETAARLGARHFLMGGNDPDEARATANFSRFCELSAPFGLKGILEFIPYTQTRTLEDAYRVVSAAGQSNAGVLVDALHLSRSGGSPRHLRALDPAWLAYCQICDAQAEVPSLSELPSEARSNRLYPGLGTLPLTELLDALPAGVPIGVEAPCAEYAGLAVVERGRLCGLATRVFLHGYQKHAAELSRLNVI
jgi:sugar phosphate isomerase/epimerase